MSSIYFPLFRAVHTNVDLFIPHALSTGTVHNFKCLKFSSLYLIDKEKNTFYLKKAHETTSLHQCRRVKPPYKQYRLDNIVKIKI